MIRKPAIITAASIAGVILAGGAAVGANIGILDAADNGPIGDLSAEGVLTAGPTSVPDADEAAARHLFAVEPAGDVELALTDNGLAVAGVRPDPGWTWRFLGGSGESDVAIRFESADDTLDFTADLNSDGTIGARVVRPDDIQSSPSPTTPELDDDDDAPDEDDRYEHDDDDHDEYEGRDEDD